LPDWAYRATSETGVAPVFSVVDLKLIAADDTHAAVGSGAAPPIDHGADMRAAIANIHKRCELVV